MATHNDNTPGTGTINRAGTLCCNLLTFKLTKMKRLCYRDVVTS